MEESKDLQVIDNLEAQITQLTTIDNLETPEEAVDAKIKVSVIREYLTKKKGERKLIQRLKAGSVRLAWRLGGFLKENLIHGKPQDDTEKITLNEIGISKNQSTKYQTINNIPEDILENRLSEKLDRDEEISEQDFFNFAKAMKENPDTNNDDKEDGTTREEEERIVRDNMITLTKEQLSEIRGHDIEALNQLSNEELELILRAIIEAIMADNNQVKRKITKFTKENVITYDNYVEALGIGVAQLRAIHKSMGVGSTRIKTPLAFIHFMNNIMKIIELLETWYPENMKVCPECEGTRMSQDEHGNPEPCGNCINGQVGWYKPPEQS